MRLESIREEKIKKDTKTPKRLNKKAKKNLDEYD